MTVAVLIPVLNRPHRVGPLVESIRNSEKEIELAPLFLVSPGDTEELREVELSGADYLVTDWPAEHGDYAKKINLGCREVEAEWFLAGADDLVFQPGWADIAIKVGEKEGKRFVGTNDRANPMVMRGKHATHPLVYRSYIESLGTIDEPGKLYHEGYSHQCVDNEACGTAIFRGEFVFAQYAIVEHHHPIFPRRGVRIPMDSTYEKGMKNGKEDIAILRSREHLWDGQRSRV